jgi:hypothetical protein
MRLLGLVFIVISGVIFAACAPVIGDSCNDSVDCSVNGDRICDNAQPGGYCTIQSCEADTCPDNAVCVRFRPTPSRLAQAWCMKVCKQDGACRGQEGYSCVRAADLGTFEVEPGTELPIAQTIDVEQPDRAFCASTADLL